MPIAQNCNQCKHWEGDSESSYRARCQKLSNDRQNVMTLFNDGNNCQSFERRPLSVRFVTVNGKELNPKEFVDCFDPGDEYIYDYDDEEGYDPYDRED